MNQVPNSWYNQSLIDTKCKLKSAITVYDAREVVAARSFWVKAKLEFANVTTLTH